MLGSRATRTLLVLGVASILVAGSGRPVRERQIQSVEPGQNRLELDAAILRGSRPLRYEGLGRVARPVFGGGLDDLRLLAEDGSEVPWLLIAPKSDDEQWQRSKVFGIFRQKESSGFEADLGASRFVDAIRISGLPPPFLKRFRLEGSGDRAHWTLLTDEGTFFDLPADDLSLTRVEFPSGDFRYLRIVWDDKSSGRMPLPESVEVRLVRQASSSPTYFDATFEKRGSEPARSRFRIRLPSSNLPVVAIVLETEETTLNRTATVTEARLLEGEARPLEIGSAKLRRVVHDGIAAGSLRIPIATRPQGPDLELIVDNGDNPPLRLTRVKVELPPLPWLYFEARDEKTVLARWGDPALKTPRYDIEAKRSEVGLRPRRETIHEAIWGEVVEGQVAVAAPANPASLAGAQLDVAGFQFAKAIPVAEKGLCSLLLDIEVMAHSRGLGDLRVVDQNDRQIPYLTESRGEPLTIALRMDDLGGNGGSISSYSIDLPYDSLPENARVVLKTQARVFDRTIRIREPHATGGNREPRILASSRWQHSDPELDASALTLEVSPRGIDRLIVEVDEGDNAALEITSAEMLLPMQRLRFFHPGDETLTLMYGNESIGAPRYDLALLAPTLFGASAIEIAPGPETKARGAASAQKHRWLFWAVVGIAAIAMLAIIGRLLKPGATQ